MVAKKPHKPNPSSIPEHLRSPEESTNPSGSPSGSPHPSPSEPIPSPSPTGSTPNDDGLAGAAQDILDDDGLVQVEKIAQSVSSTSWEDLLGTVFDSVDLLAEGTIFDAFCIGGKKRDHLAQLWGDYLEPRFTLSGKEDWLIPAACSLIYLGGPALVTVKRLRARREDEARIFEEEDEEE